METYALNSGGWYRLPLRKGKIKYALHLGCKVMWIISYIFVLVASFTATFVVFKYCIQTQDLNATIALGAVFATFGSAIISVFSLYSNMEFSKFQNNLNTLQNQLLNQKSWNRWDFLKRMERKRISQNNVQYFILRNPQIIFKTLSKQITVTFPASVSDFKEVIFIVDFIKMKLFRRKYYLHIYEQLESDLGNAFLVYNCVYDIYKNMFLYKMGNFFIWFGSCFILSSIIFSFSYYKIEDIVCKLTML